MSKLRVPKPVLKTIASIFILLIVLLGAGVGYTWYTGQNSDQNAATLEPVETPAFPARKPVTPAANAKLGASVQAITSPAAPGANASLSIRTMPGAGCSVAVVYDKTPSKDSGLVPKTADEYGIVDWTWTIDPAAAVGKWPVNVTCTKEKQSAVVRADLEVKTN